MLLTRSLPPHFLLPAWGTRQLLGALQRAHQSTSTGPEPPNPTSSQFDNRRNHEDTLPIRHFASYKGSGKPIIRTEWTAAQRALRKQHNGTSSQLDDERSYESTPFIRHFASEKRLGRSLKRIDSLSPRSNAQQAHNGASKVTLEKTKLINSLSDDKLPNKGIPTVRPERTKPTGSLFDELFPEESKAAKQIKKETLHKLPVFEWHDGPKIDWGETVEKAAEERKNWFHTIPEVKAHIPQRDAEGKRRKRDLSVLVLSSASKTLEESDFFRLGEKGEHIEGWTSGIVRVIQGRDSQTLEPLGHYFIVFSNQAAASAYLDHMIRLHALSRTHSGRESPFPLPSKFLRPGEDVKKILRGFSLVPGQSKLSLHLINRPHSKAVAQILSDGGPAAVARQKTNSEDMVLFSVDSGRITYWDVRNAISDDGRKRNLHWKLTEGEGAILKINGNQWKEEDELSKESRYSHPDRRFVRGPTKFILSFKDSHEARRFVRDWHRRPFPVQKEHKIGDEPPPIINVEMFW